MPASRRVARAVSAVLNLAPRHGEVSMVRLVQAVGDSRDRRIDIEMEELAPGVCGQWRQYRDHDAFLIQQGLPAWDRTLAHELGHLVLGHEGISVVDAAREGTELVSEDLIKYMLNQRTGCMGPSGEDAEQEAEDFAALLATAWADCARIGHRSFRFASGRRSGDRLGHRRTAGGGHWTSGRLGPGEQTIGG